MLLNEGHILWKPLSSLLGAIFSVGALLNLLVHVYSNSAIGHIIF